MSYEPFRTTRDTELVELALEGDSEAYGALARRAIPVAAGVVKRMVRDQSAADEVLQRATVEAYLSLARLRDREKFSSWFCGIAINLARSHLRDLGNAELSLESLAGGVRLEAVFGASTSVDPARIAEEAEISAVVRDAIASLPGGSRAAAAMYYGEGLKTPEIADRLGISDGTTRVRLSRARKRLRERLIASGLVERHTNDGRRRRPGMIEVEVADVIEQELTSDEGLRTTCVVTLYDDRSRRVLPIWIGVNEGTAIALALQQTLPPRPLTYSFVANLVQSAGARMEEVRIARLEDDTFHATVLLNAGGKAPIEVDSRPSDAINLALITGSPVFVADEVMEKCGLEVEEGTRVKRGEGARYLVEQIDWWLKPRGSSHRTDPEQIERARNQLKDAIFTTAG